MLTVQPAKPEDYPAIRQIMAESDMDYEPQELANFLVAKIGQQVVGISRLEQHQDFVFLESLAVSQANQKQGIARQLMQSILKQTGKDVYIYTIIPGFFARFGFKTVPAPSFIPTKQRYKCNECADPKKCVCMLAPQPAGVKKHDS